MNTKSALIDICDKLEDAKDVCVAMWMMADGLEEREQTAALKHVAEMAKGSILDALEMIGELRGALA